MTPKPQAHRDGLILVIDDHQYVLRALSYALSREGYRVETSLSAREGLQKAQKLRPAIVFVDAIMPKVDGYAMCERIKQQADLSATYVIMLSAKGQKVDMVRGLLAGADEYIVKPFSPREVVERVNAVLDEAGYGSPSEVVR